MNKIANPSPDAWLEEELLHMERLVEDALGLLQTLQHTQPAKLSDTLFQIRNHLHTMHRRANQQSQGADKLVALVEVSRAVNSTLELDEVLRLVMDTIVRLTNAERGFLMLYDESGELSIRVARNWEQESIHPNEFAISRTVVHRVLSDGEPILTTNAQEDPRFGGQDSIIAYNLRSILCVPLRLKEEAIGVVYADNRVRSGIFTETDRDLLAAFANQAAVAIENARLFASVRQTLTEVTELQSLMDNVFTSLASGVITADVNQVILLTNQSAERILRTPPGSLVGRRLNEVLLTHGSELDKILTRVRDSDQHVLGLELDADLPGGSVPLSLSFSPLKDPQQQVQGVAIVVDDLSEKKHLESQQRLFERMVSPAVIEQLNPDELHLGGHRTEITTLFADLRGFTRLSEQLDPEKLVAVLNLYLASAAEAILRHAGTVDKFQGDAVMALFNAPIPQADHALRATRAALDIRKAVKRLHSRLAEAYQLSFGIGIHTGEAVLGLIGTEKRLDYTAIGDSVNSAKRIQESTEAGQILISHETYQQISSQIEARKTNPVSAKGKTQPLYVYEVIGLIPQPANTQAD